MASESFANLRYQPIKPGFAYGTFGDFKLIVDTNTGFFNATKLCEAGGKKFCSWRRSRQAEELFARLKGQCDEPLSYEVHARIDPTDVALKGTYLSRRFVTPLACWLSPAFAMRVNDIVLDHFERESRETRSMEWEIEVPNGEAVVDLDDLPDPSKRHVFVLVRTNDAYPYYAIRCLKKVRNAQVRKLKRKYADLVVVFEIPYNPDAVNLFTEIKENIKGIRTFYNGIALADGYTIEAFERDAKRIAEEKSLA